MANENKHLHLLLSPQTHVSPFSPFGGSPKKPSFPIVDRQDHGNTLIHTLTQIKEEQEQILEEESKDYKLKADNGLLVTFEGFPNFDIAIESLASGGIELLNMQVSHGEGHSVTQQQVTVFIPFGKLHTLENKIQNYLDETKDKNDKPNNQALINSIQSLKKAAIEQLWADDQQFFPQDENEIFWWEVWLLRVENNAFVDDFKAIARDLDIQFTDRTLNFPERSILLVRTSKKQLSSSSLLLSRIAVLKRVRETAHFFTEELTKIEQLEWINELTGRLVIEPSANPFYVCILDTGMNIGHPLLSPFITANDQFVNDPNDIPTDDNGHGTGMGGLSIYGDLTDIFTSTDTITIPHKLESVKILNNSNDNAGKNYGLITLDAISLVEIDNPNRNRIFTMAVTTADSTHHGLPTAWSSTIDMLTSDSEANENRIRRLFLISAGNVSFDDELKNYPFYNSSKEIEDPAQAWNALTIGAFTQKITIQESNSYKPLAPYGGLSPYSTSSASDEWNNNMPLKPDVVFEGGNIAYDGSFYTSLDSLSVLTTSHDISNQYLTTFWATSAATALASKFTAEIYSQYPTLWPETIRALIIHSAEWSETMMNQFQGSTPKEQIKNVIKHVGFGIPNRDKALWSLNNSVVMIIENEFQPYEKTKEHKNSQINIHDLPWPKDFLQSIGELNAKLTITLSYFIEPNPSGRAIGKYTYPSHQLQFDLKRPTENKEHFLARINKKSRDEYQHSIEKTSDEWLLGPNLRHKGSIHKDIWSGTAAELAERNFLAIYPSSGWWKTRDKLKKWNSKTRYALIISIETPEIEQDISLYNEIKNIIEIPLEIENAIPI